MASEKGKVKNSRKRKKAPSHKTAATAPILTDTARPARPLFRLLPLTILTAVCLFGLKVAEIIETGKNLSESLIDTVQASQDKTPPAADTAKAAPAAAPAKEESHEQAGEHGEPKGKKAEGPTDVSTTPPAPTPQGQGMDVPDQPTYNKRELSVLENLSERRVKIEQLERELGLREKVLEATEQRIDEKLAELSRLNTEVKDMLVVHSKEEETKMNSLVKIYEAMKPKEAARIFDEMDMDVLLMVVGKMNERRLAPVLAAMSPAKAKDVTQQLADQQRNRQQTIDLSEKQVNSPPL